ncbi:1,2-phenylacetyl-CoA epoxidase subunit PaaC [Nonomuraea endophytica]|uniref:Ring-1,2-phenylacetyl-CoA epoxidase subunit PaaC n=1 Tax=Nonomuraea endophytica TaxID=714136 RepID=A0A7W8ACF9_9ACTN|nr:1,2-phenylacetyl-CoA epoxidase subunit PaaC [Nonomuraea endophytica]MBB5083104.1 ring-1,2-phenylacetyl-CoA epoxidase subunit PaaC [Nonomuraea endophytica]
MNSLEIGDDCLVLSQRLAEWVTRAPTLEEDVALANLSLDLLGQARSLLSRVGDEDELAYLRGPEEFRNCLLVEQPNGDFAHTVVRHLLYASFLFEVYGAHPEDGVAAKGVKEIAYHRDYAALWTRRLGLGTDESHRRMTAALDALWPFTGELFAQDAQDARDTQDTRDAQEAHDARDAQEAQDARDAQEAQDARDAQDAQDAQDAGLRESWVEYVGAVLGEAGLVVPEGVEQRYGGRKGVHTEHLGVLLDEMQALHREHQGATW